MRGDGRDGGVGEKVGAGMGEQGGEDKATITLDGQTDRQTERQFGGHKGYTVE